jgi:cobalt transporter subunit CbtB
MGMKRECGDGNPEAAAAPATVSGERKAKLPLGHAREGGLKLRPASQETCLSENSNAAAEGAVKEIIMAMSTHHNAAAAGALNVAPAQSRAQTIQSALLAALIGGVLIFITGFAHPQAIHNGTHDTRHALSFPCH